MLILYILLRRQMVKQPKPTLKPTINPPYSSLKQFLINHKPLNTSILNIQNLQRSFSVVMIIDSNNGYYYGQAHDNVKEGFGVCFQFNGTVYEGQWKNGIKEGKGVQKYSNGEYYQGQFHNGCKSGSGVSKDINGNVYQGEWRQGKRCGSGAFTNNKGQSYIGEWKNDMEQGYGILTEPGGVKYEGLFAAGKKSGKGVQAYTNGSIYKGYFKDNLFHGFGQFYQKNGNSYRGEYHMGKREGPGQLNQKYPTVKSYQGYFKQDMKWGYGVYSWNSGSVYKGFFQRDLRNGYGEMYWPEGNIYRGWWRDGVQHGKGQLFVLNEGLMKGIFNNNHLTILTEQTKLTKQEYQNNLNYSNTIPSGPNKYGKSLSKSRKLSKKKRVDQINKSLSPQAHVRSKRKIVKSSLDNVQFPLLFHNHRRLKTEASNKKQLQLQTIVLKKKKQDKNEGRYQKRSEPIVEALQSCNRGKKLHSAMSIRESFIKSVKHNSVITQPETQDSYTFWNKKKQLQF